MNAICLFSEGGFPGGSASKEPACNMGDLGLIPGLGRSSGEGNGYPLQFSGLESPVDGGSWQVKVHGVAELDTAEEQTQSTEILG